MKKIKDTFEEIDNLNEQPVLKQELNEDKKVDVFNALNLYNENLGEAYAKDGYNPLGDDFVLTEEFAFDVLSKKQNDKDIFPESFLENNNKKISKHFQNSLNKGTELINKLNSELSSVTDEKLKKQIKDTIVFLKNRNELLKMNISKLKQKDANALKMYKELFGLDSELSELLKDTFNEKANLQLIVQNMLNTCKFRANKFKSKAVLQEQNYKTEIQNEINKEVASQQANIATNIAQQEQFKKEDLKENKTEQKQQPTKQSETLKETELSQ